MGAEGVGDAISRDSGGVSTREEGDVSGGDADPKQTFGIRMRQWFVGQGTRCFVGSGTCDADIE